MTTLRETILTVLHARLSALPAKTLRGEVLPERVPAEGLLILRDGEPGEPEVTLSPMRYHYEHRAEIEAVVQGATRDAAFDTLTSSIATALAADRTLGGLCDWIEAEAPRPVDLPVEGAASLKAAVIPVVLHYSLSDPLGAAAPVDPDPPAPPPEPLPENLIPEAEAAFETAGAWSAAGSWSIAGGVASHAATALAENLEYDVVIPEGWVLVSYRILESNLQNGINVQLGGGFYNVNEARSRVGVHAHLIPSAGHTRTRWIAQGGWEGVIDDVAVRDVTEIQFRPADVYVLAGQSNMAGGSAVPVDPPIDDVHPLISYLAGTTATHLGGKTGEMRPAIDPLQNYGGTVLGVGPGMAAARGMLATLAPGRRIALVAAAKGGTSLVGSGSDWEAGTGDAYLNAVAQAQLALSLLPAGSAIRGLFWSQGESDNGPNVEATGVANQNAGSGFLAAPLLSAKSCGFPMASKTTLNAKNLEALGAERLAQLLIEISTGNAAAKRQLRLALAGAQSPKEAAREITKRLTSIARARTFVDWQNRKPLVTDLQMQHRAIMEQIAPHDPAEALTLLWRFMALARSVFDRCDDSSGIVSDIFHQACANLGEVAVAARPEPGALAERVLDALQDNGYGQHDGLIAIIAPALGAEGIARLKELVEELDRTPVPVPPKSDWKAVGWGSGDTRYEHEMEERSRQSTVKMALQDIADAQGDADAFIAQYEPEVRKVPKIAAEIAQRLLAAGRAGDALGFIERAEVKQDRWTAREWQDARIAVLEALGRTDDAQAFRWACFKRDLTSDYLRAYLKRLPDFDDIEAEERALDHAAGHAGLLAALGFFLEWPSPDRAAALLIDRHAEIDGNHYEFLVPAAEALSERHPLAATLALRAMIDFTLTKARSKRYGYAAQHLTTCAELARRIEDFAPVETHDAYLARLKQGHGRKSGFWSLVGR